MAEYRQLNGVRTWYDVQGAGEVLLMLHPGGGGVDSRAFGINLKTLTVQFRVFLPERRGHGRTPDAPGAYSFRLVAEDTIAFIEEVIGPGPVPNASGQPYADAHGSGKNFMSDPDYGR